MDGLVPNSNRANISFRVRMAGTVDLTGFIPDDFAHRMPTTIRTSRFRNYTVIRDSLYNIPELPMNLSEETYLLVHGLVIDGRIPHDAVIFEGERRITFKLKRLPLINRSMVRAPSAQALFELEWRLLKEQARAKVFNGLLEQNFPKTSTTLATTYGETAAAFLKELGFSDYGFEPKRRSAPATDEYTAFVLDVKIKGYSTLPSLAKAAESLTSTRANGPTLLMLPYLREYEALLATSAYRKSANPAAILEPWLRSEAASATQSTRELAFERAKIVFAIITGGVGFQEFVGVEGGTLTLDCDGSPVTFTVEQKPEQVKI